MTYATGKEIKTVCSYRFPAFFHPAFPGVDSLHHQHEVFPRKGVRPAVFLHGGEREAAPLEFQVIDDKTAVLHVQGFQGGAPAVDEQVYIPVAHLLLHMVAYQTAQRVKTLPHVTGIWIQPVSHRGVQVKHGPGA